MCLYGYIIWFICNKVFYIKYTIIVRANTFTVHEHIYFVLTKMLKENIYLNNTKLQVYQFHDLIYLFFIC